MSIGGVRWPERYRPERCPVHVKNEMDIAAPVERVWAWLVRAPLWPRWYPNSARVNLLSGVGPDLREGTRFRWWTFGVPILSEVHELVPMERLAWDAHCPGVDAYHAWVLSPTSTGCHVLTEETQHGWLATLSHAVLPRRMYRGHQLWLATLGQQARAGEPPER
ncbi:MAG: SRPBCC domain-containing protein [Gemmatimonadaceae bacterium]